MKRALIVSNSSGLVTLFLKNDIEILKRKGYVIDVACNTNYPDNNTDVFFYTYGISVTHVDFPIRDLNITKIITSYKKILELLKTNHYAIVHCHTTIASVIAREALRKYRKRGTKVIYTSHGFPFYKGNDGIKAKAFFYFEKWYSKYTDAIITICEEDFKNAKKMQCPSVYLMNGVGVEIDRFQLTEFDINSYRSSLGILQRDKVILAIGELNTNKNHQVLIKALNKISDPDMVLVICGREVTEIGKQIELEELAGRLNVRLKFLGYRKDIPEICHCADIGAISSFKEGLGLSGIEMLASGIPVVGSNRQGIKDYVIDGKTGYLADPNDFDSFARAISNCFRLLNSSFTEKNCREMVKKYDKKQSYKSIENVYKEIGY